jgi:acyl-CoA thioester hydrolase
VIHIGTSSLQLYEELWQEWTLCAKETATYVNYNVKQKKAEPIPQAIRVELQTHFYTEENSEAN